MTCYTQSPADELPLPELLKRSGRSGGASSGLHADANPLSASIVSLQTCWRALQPARGLSTGAQLGGAVGELGSARRRGGETQGTDAGEMRIARAL